MSSLPQPESRSLPKTGRRDSLPAVSDFPKGLTPITPVLLENLMKDKRYWHPTKRDPAFQRQIERGFQALYPDLGRDATGRQRRGEPRNDLAFDGKGNVVPFQNASADSASPNSASGGGEVQVRAYTQSRDGETVQVAQHTRSAPGNGPGDGLGNAAGETKVVSAGLGRQSRNHPDMPDEYRRLIDIADIDMDANARAAMYMTPKALYDAVKTGGEWDYKSRRDLGQKLKDAGLSDDEIQAFGNFHFGYIASAVNAPLGYTLAGAGLYQVFSQKGGDKLEAIGTIPYGSGLSNAEAQRKTEQGYQWGDNPGDSKDIMAGYLYHRSRKQKR